ncbi:uncharacterized small protein (DUF1192 family) [Methylobacterium brachiatum]|uniref:Uncharacterized small protein (DUF1192 family) n=1 Tax=Methylobacterium brachiatum TaxID=269660 RepID=A0AAJ1TYT2_9HYPH|nr:hypothetical protein [Methylobacterium brachiatum]MCB4805162.1 hypothetical protein [Methylobacterium brachiatum]MDQ0546092.1 uncharacterized small protein (DUF1192 family) [Methylobacterium brachiatum]
MTNPDIAALKRELAEAKAELAATRRAQAITAAIAGRKFKSPDAVSALVEKQVAFNENGTLVAVDQDGVYRIGRADGAYMSVNELVDEIERSGAETAKTENRTTPKHNPFMGPHKNVTAAMQLYRDNPELAREYALEAGIRLDNIR